MQKSGIYQYRLYTGNHAGECQQDGIVHFRFRFFAVRGADNGTYYTRSGDFTWALDNMGNRVLATSKGQEVLDYQGNPIKCCRMALRAMRFPLERMVLWHIRQQTAPIYRPGSRWHCTSSTIQKDWKRPGQPFEATQASGVPLSEIATAGVTRSTIAQGYLEASNVNVADEMVNLIVAQRAYEMNSKAIRPPIPCWNRQTISSDRRR